MELTKGKKAIMHPGYMFIAGLIIGVVLTILWAKGIIALQFPFCK